MALMLLAGSALALVLASQQAAPRGAETIMAAERAFAADVVAMGAGRAFLKWGEPGALILSARGADPVEAVFADRPPQATERPLVWWPNWIALSRAGDLAVSNGPVESGGARSGYFLTIWRRQADGDWRWLADGGAPADSSAAPGPDRPPLVIPESSGPGPDPAEASLIAAESGFAAAAAVDQTEAHLSVLSANARLLLPSRPPLDGVDRNREGLGDWPSVWTFASPVQTGVAGSGDLGWTYGAVTWPAGEGGGEGRYLRVWRAEQGRWALMYEQIVKRADAAR
jgi:ketosteroid isomerase-like protein